VGVYRTSVWAAFKPLAKIQGVFCATEGTMARPTDEVKNHIIKCRVGDDLYDRIKDSNVSEVIREALERKRYDTDTQRALDDIASIVEANGGTFDNFIKTLDEQLIWGEVEIENGVLKAFTGV